MPAQILFVDDPSALPEALGTVTDDVIGVDVERADAHLYHRRAALVQVGDADVCVLVDPIAIPEPTPLASLCAERLVVLHALENDLLPMDALGVALPRLADTGIAAALLGLPTGLGDLLHEVLGVALDTDKAKYQRADWSRRPLSEGMKAYAAGDVLHLPALWRALEQRLDEAGRRSWYEQELEATIELARTDTRDWEKVKGSGRLDADQRSTLRVLWEAREALCRTHDIAPNRLLHDKTLLSLAQDPPADPAALVDRDKQRRRGPVRDHAEALFTALETGMATPPEPRSSSRRWRDDQRAAFDAVRTARNDATEALGLDAGFACPSRQLRAAITADPTDAEAFADAAGLRPWQREQLLDALWDAYDDAMAAAADESE